MKYHLKKSFSSLPIFINSLLQGPSRSNFVSRSSRSDTEYPLFPISTLRSDVNTISPRNGDTMTNNLEIGTLKDKEVIVFVICV